MEKEKRMVGVFFKVNNKKFITEVDYRSRGKFEKLLENFSENVNMCHPKNLEDFKFIPLCDILSVAHDNLEEKQRANKLILNLMAQNACKFESKK